MRLLVLSVAAVLVVAPAAAPATEPRFSSTQVEIVQIDAVVTDADGRPIRDLTTADFEVLEDGKPQAVTHFTFAGRPPRAPATERSTAAAPPDGVDPPPPAPRKVLIVVDDLHVAFGGLEHTKAALKRILSDFISGEDEVALVATSRAVALETFTRDRGLVLDAIGRLKPRQASMVATRMAQMTPGQAELILGGDRGAVELAGRNMLAEPGSLYDNMGPRAAVEAGELATTVGQMGEAKQIVAENDARRQARLVLLEALSYSSTTLRGVDSALRSLAALPGRKMCLLVSDGFLMGTGTSEERTEDLQRLVDAATRSGVVVYSLDSRGLATSGGDAGTSGSSAPGLQFRIDRRVEQIQRDTIATVAEQTGGFLVHGTNDLAAGLRRMLDDGDSYYAIAYEPTNTKRDGRFRKIEVRVPAHKGYLVRTRRGYFAPDDKRKNVTAAVRIPVTLSIDYLELPSVGPQALILTRLDLSGLAWQKVKDRQQATVDLLGGLYDAAGAPVAPFGRRADLSFTAAEHKRAIQEGFHVRHVLAVKPGRYEVRMQVRDGSGQTIGGASDGFEVPDLADKKLNASSVFLSASQAASLSGAGEGEALRDAHAVRRFKKGDQLYFQLYVYNPATDEKGASDVVLQAQLRAADKVVAASKPQPVAFQQKDGVPLPLTNGMGLEGLATGPYELRVVVVDRRVNATVSRSIDFTLD